MLIMPPPASEDVAKVAWLAMQETGYTPGASSSAPIPAPAAAAVAHTPGTFAEYHARRSAGL